MPASKTKHDTFSRVVKKSWGDDRIQIIDKLIFLRHYIFGQKGIFMKEFRNFIILLVLFLVCYFFPLSIITFRGPVYEALALVQWYAREHVLLCLVPAFFIAGAVSVFISKASVVKYFGNDANKFLAYGVASISGAILAVCSCTVLPLFSGIHKRGAGIGPAIAFLYSGPAINILAIIITARVLGFELGIARAIGAILFSIIIGLIMQLIFLKEDKDNNNQKIIEFEENKTERSLWQTGVYFFVMTAILIFANWSANKENSFWGYIYRIKWYLTAILLIILAYMVLKWFKKVEHKEWLESSWYFAKQIFPLLLIGVFFAGILLGRPGKEGLIPSSVIVSLVGGNSLLANFFASISGAFMYFATLTEVPIIEGLIGSGMGKGPALSLLLAGPALSLPNMIVIRGVIGTKKTLVYISLVILMATLSGVIYGLLF